jgi:hypothetical protein
MIPRKRRDFEESLQEGFREWAEQNPERAGQLTADELDELLSIFGVGGPLNQQGVDYYVALIERKRLLRERFECVINTEYIDQIEPIVAEMFRAVCPYLDRLGQTEARPPASPP